jgi:hypothetical protein
VVADAVAEAVAVAAFREEVAAGAEVVVAVAFRGAVAAVFRGLVGEISPAEVPVAPRGRGTFPAAAGAVVWLIPETPHRVPGLPLAND